MKYSQPSSWQNNRKTMKYIEAKRLKQALKEELNDLDQHFAGRDLNEHLEGYVHGFKRATMNAIYHIHELDKERPEKKTICLYLIVFALFVFVAVTTFFFCELLQAI